MSGDFIDKGNVSAYTPAFKFVSALREKLAISIERVLLVPGNHDVVDDDGFYSLKSKKDGLKEGEFVQKADIFVVRNQEKWNERFKPFSDHLYHPLFQQAYPLDPKNQGQGFPPSDTGVQFLAFNSAWEIDQTDRNRSGLHQAAILDGIAAANKHTVGKIPLRTLCGTTLCCTWKE